MPEAEAKKASMDKDERLIFIMVALATAALLLAVGAVFVR